MIDQPGILTYIIDHPPGIVFFTSLLIALPGLLGWRSAKVLSDGTLAERRRESFEPVGQQFECS